MAMVRADNCSVSDAGRCGSVSVAVIVGIAVADRLSVAVKLLAWLDADQTGGNGMHDVSHGATQALTTGSLSGNKNQNEKA
jgi:hypothetical protein